MGNPSSKSSFKNNNLSKEINFIEPNQYQFAHIDKSIQNILV